MSGNEDEIDLGDNCKIGFTKDGNITIKGNCNGKTLNRTEIKLFDRVSDIIEDEDE